MFVSLLIMRTMLQPNGAVNVLLRNLGWIAQDASLPFFTDPTWARVTVIVVNIWVGVPYTLLQLTGVLQNIPEELYEAAKVDGANALQIFFQDHNAIYALCDSTVFDCDIYRKCK